MPENVESSAVATGLGKVSFHFNPKEGQCQKCTNYYTIALISNASKIMLKILQARLQQYVNQELPDVQVRLRKGRGIRDQIANICWIIEKAREFQKSIYFCFTDYAIVDHILSELSTMTRPSWVALQGMVHSFIELDKAVVHVIRLVSFL